VKRVIVRLLIVLVAFTVVKRIQELDPRTW
jgi:hypothetical protein